MTDRLLTKQECPFCGGRDIRSHHRGHPSSGEWVIECHNCSCELTGFASEQDAWKTWNGRWKPVLSGDSRLPSSNEQAPNPDGIGRAVVGPGWYLPWHAINDLQRQSVDRLIKRSKAAHYTNVRVRINGDWEESEADWIKHLVRSPADETTGELERLRELQEKALALDDAVAEFGIDKPEYIAEVYQAFHDVLHDGHGSPSAVETKPECPPCIWRNGCQQKQDCEAAGYCRSEALFPQKAIADCGNPVMVNSEWYGPCTLPSGHEGDCKREKKASAGSVACTYPDCHCSPLDATGQPREQCGDPDHSDFQRNAPWIAGGDF